jgi:hypothetical protein
MIIHDLLEVNHKTTMPVVVLFRFRPRPLYRIIPDITFTTATQTRSLSIVTPCSVDVVVEFRGNVATSMWRGLE